ncbi:hypothetical protein BCON_0018g00240 [Botryotinia convoluta]|uniref:Uncharacterized protein n=1 Tax=Botryotinia convoluta TaxID=54673 RepID=A0A4Z1IM48_9HELO|nr:hypothetical protein BCON_0018g00240 [Botryotinia convoluta]
MFSSLIVLASTVFIATNVLALSTTTTHSSPTAAPTILQRDATTTASPASTSPLYFLTTNYITIAGVTNAHVTISAKTVSFAVPTCIQTLTPDKNGYLPPGTCNALYNYYPSSTSAIAFAAIFGVLTLAHIIQAFLYRKAYSFFIVSASIWGLTAFILRIVSTYNQQDNVLELMSSIFASTISPLINAYYFILLRHLVHHYLPSRSLLGIRAHFIVLPFLLFNGVAFVLESVGATMMEKRDFEWEQRNADHVHIGGLAVQMLVIFVFLGVLVAFWREMNGLGRMGVIGTGWKGLLGAMFGVLCLIMIQILFSIARFSIGDKTSSALSTHELYFYIFEIFPAVLAISIMNALHPGRIMTGEEKMESLWSILTCCSPFCRSRSKARKNNDTGLIASSKELIGLDEEGFEGKFDKNDEPPSYTPLIRYIKQSPIVFCELNLRSTREVEMSSTKSRATFATRRDDSDDSDDSDYFYGFEDRLNCSNSNRFRKLIILKPGIMEQKVKGNEVTQRWGLPTPCECKARDNTADVIVSAIEFWKPSALLKLLDLNRLGIEEICTLEDHYKENWHKCHISKGDRILAGRLGHSLPWHQERLKEFEFGCYITTKNGIWIAIDKSEAAGGDATAANQNSAPQQVSLQSDTDVKTESVTANPTSTKKTDQSHLQGTKKRKRTAE